LADARQVANTTTLINNMNLAKMMSRDARDGGEQHDVPHKDAVALELGGRVGRLPLATMFQEVTKLAGEENRRSLVS
jgi:hypothetical protein